MISETMSRAAGARLRVLLTLSCTLYVLSGCASLGYYKQLLDGSLVQVLQNESLAKEAAIWAVYPSGRLLAPKVRAFIDYFSESFGELPYWDDGLQ